MAKKNKFGVTETPVNYDPAKKVLTEYLNSNPSGASAQARWWISDKPHNDITAVVNAITENQKYREANNLRFARLYSNMEIIGFGAGLYDRVPSSAAMSNRVSYNVVRSVIDTAASKIGKMRPRVIALTSGGSWSQQQSAKRLTKYIQGQLEATGAYQEMSRAFVDACVFGTGAVKYFHDGESVKVERVFINEVLVDDCEGVYGKPRQIHHIKFLSRDVVLAMFPEHAQAIAACDPGAKGAYVSNSTADLIQVRESWHLRSHPSIDDGKHMITIDNATLFSESYTSEDFPFIFLRWSPRLLGFFGSGIAEELLGIQIEINKLLKLIQQAQRVACVPRVLIERGAKIIEDHISNEIGSIINYTGTPPTIVTPNAMPAEIYSHLQNLFNKAYEMVGVSQLSAGSKKPAGLDSGVALREFNDIETERFSLVAQMFEDAYVKLGERIILMACNLAESNPKAYIKVVDKHIVEKIKWKDLKVDMDEFVLQLYPASLLPTQPAGRLQKVQELYQAGMISQITAKSLLQFPDVEDAMDQELAAFNDIHMVIEGMLDSGIYSAPEPFMNPPLCISIAQSQYLRAKTAKVEEEKLELLRRFMEDAAVLIELSQAPAPGAPGAESLAVPEAAPVSDLLPLPSA